MMIGYDPDPPGRQFIPNGLPAATNYGLCSSMCTSDMSGNVTVFGVFIVSKFNCI